MVAALYMDDFTKELKDIFNACIGAFVAAIAVTGAQYAGAHIIPLLHALVVFAGAIINLKGNK